MTFAEKLTRLQRVSGMSCKEFAAAAGISDQTVRYVKAGRQIPRLDTLQALCKLFDCTLSELLHGVE